MSATVSSASPWCTSWSPRPTPSAARARRKTCCCVWCGRSSASRAAPPASATWSSSTRSARTAPASPTPDGLKRGQTLCSAKGLTPFDGTFDGTPLQEKFMTRFVLALLASLSLAGIASSAGLSSRDELDAEVRAALEELYKHSGAAKELAGKASGMLVFPKVVKGGL